MRKRNLILLLILVVISMALLIFYGVNNKSDAPVAPTDEKAIVEGEPEDPEPVIQEIVKLAQNGQVTDVPFTAGKTSKEMVHQQWGQPQQVSEVVNKEYEDYVEHAATVGFKDSFVFDIRSFKANSENIHFADIKKVMGTPDEVRYFKDATTNQIILVYQVNDTFQLKWILPKPTDNEPNPVVHHISVYTEVEQQVTEMIEQMSLDEKIGQMMFAGISGTTLQPETKDLIRKFKVGGLIMYANNLKTPQQSTTLINDLMAENENNRLPLFMGTDQEGGRVIRLPGPLTNLPTSKIIGSINQSEFSFEVGRLLGEELMAFGFNLDFAPVLDVNSNPANPIIGDRSFSNNPDIVSRLGIQTMKGLESKQVIPVVKHFPGHGDTSVDSHLELPKVMKSLDELNKLEIIPFKNAIENGADVVMVGHILLPKIDQKYPSSMSKEIITGILREQLAFDGVVMTDDMTMKAITNHFEIGQAAVDSVKAGSDIILIAHDFSNVQSAIEALKSAVQQGEITEDRINDSVRRIIQLKRKFKLENNKVTSVDFPKLNADIENVLNTYMK